MGKTKLWAIALMLIITIFITISNLLYKAGMVKIPETMGFILVFFGLALYGVSTILLIIAFKGGELTILYPMIALSYIWISIASPMLFPTDTMNQVKWIGVGCVVLGIIAMAAGNK